MKVCGGKVFIEKGSRTTDMALLELILVIIAILIIFELFKHHFSKGLVKYFLIFIVVIFILLIASAYIDFGSLLGQGSTFSNTGQAIAGGVSNDLHGVDIQNSDTLHALGEKISDFFKQLLE